MSILRGVLVLCAGVAVERANSVSQETTLLSDLNIMVTVDSAAEEEAFKAW